MKDIETEYWERVQWSCPRCIEDYDAESAELPPPSLLLVDTADRSIDKFEVWGVGDDYDYDFDYNLWKRANSTEQVVVCPECETVFDAGFTPRAETDK